jgi:putative FmdB family regulatory protein
MDKRCSMPCHSQSCDGFCQPIPREVMALEINVAFMVTLLNNESTSLMIGIPEMLDDAMPFYEYECSACKFYVEALQKITDPPMVKCPSCGKQTLHRLISAPVFRLKGSGWYETDFKSDKENKRNLAGGEDKPSESKDGEESKEKAVRRAPAKSKKPKKKVTASPAKKTGKRPAKKSAAKKASKTKVKPAKKKAGKKKAAKKK